MWVAIGAYLTVLEHSDYRYVRHQTVLHALHHKYRNVNFASLDIIDKWAGTYEDLDNETDKNKSQATSYEGTDTGKQDCVTMDKPMRKRAAPSYSQCVKTAAVSAISISLFAVPLWQLG